MFVYNQKDIATYSNVSHLEKHEVATISIKYEILKNNAELVRCTY